MTFARALNRLAEVAVATSDRSAILATALAEVGTTLDVDRVNVYHMSVGQGFAVGVDSWQHPACALPPTRAIYPMSMFRAGLAHVRSTRGPASSTVEDPHPWILEDGVAQLLHHDLGIKSLLWQPFAFREEPDIEFHLLVLHRVRESRPWPEDELAFLASVGRIVERALDRAPDAARTAEERYRLLYDATPSMFFTVSADGRVASMNRFAEEHLGYAAAEIVGGPVAALVHPGDRDRIAAQLAEVFAAPDQLARLVFRKVRRDGSELWVKETVRVVRSAGDAAEALIVCEDITDQRRAEEAMLAAQKLETLGVLAGGIAHDFNNLLATILGNLELARLRLATPAGSSGGPTSGVGTALERAERGTLRAAELVRGLLSYSAASIERREPVRLAGLIADLSELLRVSVAAGIDLAVSVSPELPAVHADANQIRQVLMNLVVNAAESIGASGGRVEVRATEVPHAGGERWVQIEVVDDGVGMSAATRERIFDPFFTTKVHGRGLGLAAVRGIVAAHDGRISVRSELGRGSTFTVLLPACASEVPAAEAPPPVAPARNGTLLVVDDDHVVRAVLAELVSDLGYDVVEADGVASGLDAFRRTEGVACALVDLAMPGGGGAALLAELRKIDLRVPVVLMSGFAESDAVAAMRAGCPIPAFLQKPFTRAQLAAVLADAMRPRS